MPNIDERYLYCSPQVNLTVTGQAGFTVLRNVACFYRTLNGFWRMVGNISATQTSNASGDVAIAGVVFIQNQAVSFYQANTKVAAGYAVGGTGNIIVTYEAAITSIVISFDVELAAKPTYYLPEGV